MAAPEVAAGIIEHATELDRLRSELELLLDEINKLHGLLQTNPAVVENPGDESLSRLKMLYIQAKELSEAEVIISNRLLEQLDALLASETAKQPRKKPESTKKRKRDPNGPKISPSIRSHLESLANLKGEHVAARVTQKDGETYEWVVVKVIHFDKEREEFEVVDEEPGDDEESNGQRKYKLPTSHIIQLPRRTNPSTANDFPPGEHVLAVYPETTTLYKATVVQAHKRKTDDYVLEFDDDEENGSLPRRLVPFYMVVPLPKGYQQ